ncbi:MAG: ATP-binding cassette domain-containing protein [Buchnera aphidicola (Meitanaphis elongallis)]
MSLVQIQNASFSLNQEKLLNNVNFKINKKERICLVGKNGTGKSTFLNIIAKKELLDRGFVIHKKNIKIKYLEQNIIHDHTKSIFEFVYEGIDDDSKHLKNYFYILNKEKLDMSLNHSSKLVQLKEIFTNKKLWKKKEKIDDIIERFNLNNNSMLSSLSGGWLRKVELGTILISEPDLIILDEPTNHLDVITINWLEKFLTKNFISVLFVSHNRSFINNVSTKIIHLNSGNLISWVGNYNSFLKNQYNDKNIIETNKIKFNKKIEKEILWANSGVKARSTKSESRMQQLKNMINMKNSEQKVIRDTEILINEDNYPGNIFFKLKNIHFYLNKTIIINNFSDTIKKGEKIALVGINGCGKSVLLKLILGELQPSSGTIYSNTNIKTAYFDQKRTNINLEETVLNNLSCGKEEISINDKKYHKLRYLENFLFPKEKIKLQAKVLSGGEINKLLLAKLFLQKNNVLILDEPTNDLDSDSLIKLEIALKKYKGIILLVSHDKTFIQNIANKYWHFNNIGHINKYLTFSKIEELKNIEQPFQINTYLKQHKKNFSTDKKLSSKIFQYNLQKELKNIPKKIEKIENYIKILQHEINSLNFFHTLSDNKKEILYKLKNEEKNLEKQFLRWEYLELLKNT